MLYVSKVNDDNTCIVTDTRGLTDKVYTCEEVLALVKEGKTEIQGTEKGECIPMTLATKTITRYAGEMLNPPEYNILTIIRRYSTDNYCIDSKGKLTIASNNLSGVYYDSMTLKLEDNVVLTPARLIKMGNIQSVGTRLRGRPFHKDVQRMDVLDLFFEFIKLENYGNEKMLAELRTLAGLDAYANGDVFYKGSELIYLDELGSNFVKFGKIYIIGKRYWLTSPLLSFLRRNSIQPTLGLPDYTITPKIIQDIYSTNAYEYIDLKFMGESYSGESRFFLGADFEGTNLYFIYTDANNDFARLMCLDFITFVRNNPNNWVNLELTSTHLIVDGLYGTISYNLHYLELCYNMDSKASMYFTKLKLLGADVDVTDNGVVRSLSQSNKGVLTIYGKEFVYGSIRIKEDVPLRKVILGEGTVSLDYSAFKRGNEIDVVDGCRVDIRSADRESNITLHSYLRVLEKRCKVKTVIDCPFSNSSYFYYLLSYILDDNRFSTAKDFNIEKQNIADLGFDKKHLILDIKTLIKDCFELKTFNLSWSAMQYIYQSFFKYRYDCTFIVPARSSFLYDLNNQGEEPFSRAYARLLEVIDIYYANTKAKTLVTVKSKLEESYKILL